jgi:multiple sugar transport system substrate-binding protein
MRYRTLLFIPLLVSLAVAAGAQGSIGPASPAQPQATTTITFWHAYSSDSPEVKTINNVLIPRFQRQYPRIRVRAVAVPYDSLHQKLITATAGGTLPDVVRSDIIWVPELAKLGVLVPLDRQMRDFKKLAKLTFPGALSTNRWNGRYYGLPLDTNTRVQMYNQAALDAAGIQQPPKTFAALRTMAARLKAKDIYAFADGGTSGWSVLPWIWSAGGRLTNASLTRATGHLNSAASVRGVQLLVDLHRQGAARFGNVDGGLATSDGLAQGKFATILDGPWMFPIFQGQYPNFRLRTARVPSGPGGSISVVGGEDIVMTSSSKHKGQAASFIRFMLSRFAQLEMAKVGQMTIRTDLKKQMVKIRPYYGIFLEQLATARARTPHPQWPRIDQTLESYVVKAVKGDLTVQEALTQAAREIDQLLARR